MDIMEIKIEKQVKGTRILFGNEVFLRRKYEFKLAALAMASDYKEIILPIIEPSSIYTDKAGKEILNQMYTFPDKKGRELCLRPEGTATIQQLSKQFKYQKDIKMFYMTRCYRYERPQLGRYREFWQFGIEILHPSKDYTDELISLAESMCLLFTKDIKINTDVTRGLSYYTGKGFEIECDKLGSQKQVCGGGSYKEGIGFALGFDRLMLTL